jgi:ABC-type tungstate transport system substrate-binding protein
MVEEGAILIVGGIITGLTMVMIPVVVLETDKGNFDVALDIILLFLFLLLPVNDAGWQDSPRLSCPGVD